MRPSEFAWSTLQSITQKHPSEIKLLLDDAQEYPTLESDPCGYVLHLSMPRKKREGLYTLHGMYFDNDTRGRASLWRMFRASVYHLCLHAITTDFGIYHELSENYPSTNNLMFAISLVEDFALRGHMRGRWPGLLLDSAYASQLSWLRMKSRGLEDRAISLSANLLSYSLVGKGKFSMGEEVEGQLESLYRDLVGLESIVKKYYSPTRVAPSKKKSQKSSDAQLSLYDLAALKVESVQRILDFMQSQSAYLSIIPSPPFADNHGPNKLFEETPEEEGESGEFDSGLKDACEAFSLVMTQQWIEESEKEAESESENVIEGWEYSLTVMKRLIDLHKTLDRNTHFENFLFPREDYSEFVRSRSRNIGPIRLVLDQLRAIYTVADDSFSKESGYVDIPLAVQIIASESKRNDVFIQEEIQKKTETWAILIDASKSLATYQREVKDVAVCLSEVAKDLIPNQNSWGCYAFNENFFIVKDFSEAYNSTTKARIGGLSSGLQTYLPDALTITANRLMNTPGDIKVLMVASDGFPLGYQGIERRLDQTIEKIGRSGIQLVGLGIGSSSIKNHFRSNCIVNSPSDLMKHFVKMYFELSASF